MQTYSRLVTEHSWGTFIMSIWNSDDSKRGASDGAKDFKSGKGKNLRRMGSSVKAAIYGKDAMESYAKAYHETYDGERAKQYEIYYPKPLNSGANMNTGQNIHALADANAISDFYAELSQFKRDFMDKTNDLQNFIMSMQSNSWDDENYMQFRQLFSNITHKAAGIEASIIEQSMLPVLENHIERIRKAQMKG